MDIIPIKYQEQYAKILAYINAYKNGITSDNMKSYGIDYENNFGVSMVDLKRIAGRYQHDFDFADLLWQKKWRETYILSTLLDEPEKYSIELLEKRIETAPTFEILEQLAYNIAWQVDFLDELFVRITDWSKSEIQYFMLKCTTYQLMHKKIDAISAWERISAYSYSDNAAILNVLQNLLLRITNSDQTLHPHVVTYCEKQSSESWKMLTEVIRDYGVL